MPILVKLCISNSSFTSARVRFRQRIQGLARRTQF
jgi:hypothetical protein